MPYICCHFLSFNTESHRQFICDVFPYQFKIHFMNITAGRGVMLSYGFAVHKQVFFLQVNTQIIL